MYQYLILYLLILGCLSSIFFYHIKPDSSKILTRLIKGYVSVVFIVLILFFSGWLVKLLGTNYDYKDAPTEVKVLLDKFVYEADKRGIDTSKINSLKIVYLNWETNGAYYAGACDIPTNTLYIPTKNVDDWTIFHELGHCLFKLGHLNQRSLSHEIMYPTKNENQKLDETTMNSFFRQATQNPLAQHSFTLDTNFLWDPLFWLNFIIAFLVISPIIKDILKYLRKYKKA